MFREAQGRFSKRLIKEERYPSGQREQTVNLPAMPSKVRILPSPPFFAGIAQLVEREPSKLGVAGSSPVSRSVRIWLTVKIADGATTDKGHPRRVID